MFVPKYKKVRISKKKNSKIQAICRDEKNRKQYIYNKKFVTEQQEIKFQDLIIFGKKIKRIRREYNKILVVGDYEKKILINDKFDRKKIMLCGVASRPVKLIKKNKRNIDINNPFLFSLRIKIAGLAKKEKQKILKP